MFIAPQPTGKKLRQEGHVIDEQHVAPDGAWLVFSCASYKHQAPDGAKVCVTGRESFLLTLP
jgi:hypothetical protein